MTYLIGVDVGTSAAKALAIRADGTVEATATEEYPLYRPRQGWVEQDPESWWQATTRCLHRVTQALGPRAGGIASVAFTGQMHSAVFLDRNLQVVRRAMLWCDLRTTAECAEITRRLGGRQALLACTSNPAMEGFTAPKVAWLRSNEPEQYARVKHILLPKDYIRYKITGELSTDMSDAAGTLFFDVAARRWSSHVLEAMDIPQGLLPRVRESTDVCGSVGPRISDLTGMPRGTVVGAGGADNSCGAIGAGVVQNGQLMISIGSSGVVFSQIDEPIRDPDGRIHTFNYSIPATWYLMGVMLSAGLSYSWMRDVVSSGRPCFSSGGQLASYKLLDSEAAKVSPGSEGVLFLPYLNGERSPHQDPNAKAVFFGIDSRHTRWHLVRSVLEGVAYALRDMVEIMEPLGIEKGTVRVIGGGARSQLWKQIQADVLKRSVITLSSDEGPAFGAALLGGVAAGVYSDIGEAVGRTVRVASVTEPSNNDAKTYDRYYEIYRSLYGSLSMQFRRISEVNSFLESARCAHQKQ